MQTIEELSNSIQRIEIRINEIEMRNDPKDKELLEQWNVNLKNLKLTLKERLNDT